MSDREPWLKFWTCSLSDPHLDALGPADFGRWARLLLLTKEQGADGSLTLLRPARVACALLWLDDWAELQALLKRLPNLSVTDNEMSVTASFDNWKRYQTGSSTDRVRRHRERLTSTQSTVSENETFQKRADETRVKRKHETLVKQPMKRREVEVEVDEDEEGCAVGVDLAVSTNLRSEPQPTVGISPPRSEQPPDSARQPGGARQAPRAAQTTRLLDTDLARLPDDELRRTVATLARELGDDPKDHLGRGDEPRAVLLASANALMARLARRHAPRPANAPPQQAAPAEGPRVWSDAQRAAYRDRHAEQPPEPTPPAEPEEPASPDEARTVVRGFASRARRVLEDTPPPPPAGIRRRMGPRPAATVEPPEPTDADLEVVERAVEGRAAESVTQPVGELEPTPPYEQEPPALPVEPGLAGEPVDLAELLRRRRRVLGRPR